MLTDIEELIRLPGHAANARQRDGLCLERDDTVWGIARLEVVLVDSDRQTLPKCAVLPHE